MPEQVGKENERKVETTPAARVQADWALAEEEARVLETLAELEVAVEERVGTLAVPLEEGLLHSVCKSTMETRI